MPFSRKRPSPVVDTEMFRRVVGRFATGVCVLSTVADGTDHAMTASAFTSVSARTPLRPSSTTAAGTAPSAETGA